MSVFSTAGFFAASVSAQSSNQSDLAPGPVAELLPDGNPLPGDDITPAANQSAEADPYQWAPQSENVASDSGAVAGSTSQGYPGSVSNQAATSWTPPPTQSSPKTMFRNNAPAGGNDFQPSASAFVGNGSASSCNHCNGTASGTVGTCGCEQESFQQDAFGRRGECSQCASCGQSEVVYEGFDPGEFVGNSRYHNGGGQHCGCGRCASQGCHPVATAAGGAARVAGGAVGGAARVAGGAVGGAARVAGGTAATAARVAGGAAKVAKHIVGERFVRSHERRVDRHDRIQDRRVDGVAGCCGGGCSGNCGCSYDDGCSNDCGCSNEIVSSCGCGQCDTAYTESDFVGGDCGGDCQCGAGQSFAAQSNPVEYFDGGYQGSATVAPTGPTHTWDTYCDGTAGNADNVYTPCAADAIDDACSVITGVEEDCDNVNTIFGVKGLYLNRNYESNRGFSGPGTPGGPGLFTGQTEHDDFGGLEATLTRRGAAGRGYELRYFGLTPAATTATITGNPTTNFDGATTGPNTFLSGVQRPGGLTAAQAFNLATVHQLTRESTIHNAEFNFLRMGQPVNADGGNVRETLLGFRYFRFDESLNYRGSGIAPNALPGGDISRVDWLNETTNELFGIQIGQRSEFGLFGRFRGIVGAKAGIFNNQHSNSQRVSFRGAGGAEELAQVVSGPDAGRGFSVTGDDDQVAMMGELDLGVAYQLTRNSRIRVGYQAVYVTDVALAGDQIEQNFFDIASVGQPQTEGDLFLHGGYFGMEFAF